MALPVVSLLRSLSPIRCPSLPWRGSAAPFHAAQLSSESKSKQQQQAVASTLVLKGMFYASDTVLPADFHDTRSCLVLVDVSHRNNDRETGELCRHEGRHRHFPAAPSASPLQLPIATAHAIRPHPAQGQGAVHLQVRAWRPAGAGPYPRLGSARLGGAGRTPPALGRRPRHQQATERLHTDIFGVSAGVGGRPRSSRIRTERSDD